MTNQNQQQKGILYVVATPIGNLADISQRAIDVLQSVNVIAAEDTRRTRQLLNHFSVDTPCFSLHDYNEKQRIDSIAKRLDVGESVALVSDAGTPLISDPGYALVTFLRQQDYTISPIPGACALIAALSVSGLATDRFVFEGFLSAKTEARKKQLSEISEQSGTTIIYESSHRIESCLKDMAEMLEDERQIVVTRELTKTFETVLSGTAGELIEILEQDDNQKKGEFVVLIQGKTKKDDELKPESIKLAESLCEHLPAKTAAKIAAETFGDKKNKIYQVLLEKKGAG